VIFITHDRDLHDDIDGAPDNIDGALDIYKGIVIDAHTFLDTSLMASLTIVTGGCEVSRGELLLAHLFVCAPRVYQGFQWFIMDVPWLDHGAPYISRVLLALWCHS
jgi:hypothetical protein